MVVAVEEEVAAAAVDAVEVEEGHRMVAAWVVAAFLVVAGLEWAGEGSQGIADVVVEEVERGVVAAAEEAGSLAEVVLGRAAVAVEAVRELVGRSSHRPDPSRAVLGRLRRRVVVAASVIL